MTRRPEPFDRLDARATAGCPFHTLAVVGVLVAVTAAVYAAELADAVRRAPGRPTAAG